MFIPKQLRLVGTTLLLVGFVAVFAYANLKRHERCSSFPISGCEFDEEIEAEELFCDVLLPQSFSGSDDEVSGLLAGHWKLLEFTDGMGNQFLSRGPPVLRL